MKKFQILILNNYKSFLKLLVAILFGCIIRFSLILYFEPNLKDLVEFLLVHVPSGLGFSAIMMSGVSCDTDNNTNCSANSQAKQNIGDTANYSVNNQGTQGTGNTANSGNNNSAMGSSSNNTNNSGVTPIDIMERDNNTLRLFERLTVTTRVQLDQLAHLRTTLENNISLEAAHREQLNQPNLSQEEVSSIQQRRQGLIARIATNRAQLINKQTQYSETTRRLNDILPEYVRIMSQDSDNE